MEAWYRQQAGKVAGPFSFEDLQYLVSRGNLDADDLVRRGQEGHWLAAADVQGLIDSHQSAPALPQTVSSDVGEPGAVPPPTDRSSVAAAPPDRQTSRQRPPVLPGEETLGRNPVDRITVAAVMLLLLLLLVAWWLLSRHTTVPPVATRRDPTSASRHDGVTTGISEFDRQPTEDATGGPPGDAFQPPAPPEQPAEFDGSADSPAGHTGTRPEQPEVRDAGSPQPPSEPPPRSTFSIQEFVPRTADESRIVLGSGQSDGPAPKFFQGRTPQRRAELVRKDGGSPKSEAAVELGLKWLVDHQHDAGNWSLDHFMNLGDCRGQCLPGGMRSNTAATGMALMSLLGAGHTHGSGRYRDNVRKGLEWLVNDQNKVGTFNSLGGGTMYAHGQASIALCEAYAMTGDEALRSPAQRAIDYICQAQHAGGGWRYTFRSAGDTSVMGWQILALKSAQSAGLDVPAAVFERSNLFLDSVQGTKIGSTYSYMPRRLVTPTMSAEGLLCRIYCGWPKDARGLTAGVAYLMDNPPSRDSPNAYYWYYATQVVHHKSGRPWQRWNVLMRDTLIDMQEKSGHQAGSWTPRGGHSSSGGRVYMTALAICTLEVYYRHAAVFDP